MPIHRSFLPFAAIALASASLTGGCQKKAAEPSAPKQGESQKTSFPDWVGKEAPAPQGDVDQHAVEALQAMSQFLVSQPRLQLATQGTMDVVTNDGQRIQTDGSTNYKLKKPGFLISYRSDGKNRDFYYDGKQFTVYSPNLNYYATVPAPPTNREVLDTIYKKFGIRLPLEDLFRWDNSDHAERISNFRGAYDLGTVTLDGVKTTHYAFREPDVDWEVWIDDGDKPLPRKLSIVDRTDPARPAFTTRLKWTLNPSFSDKDFTYAPGPGAMRIQLAQYKG